VPVAHLARLGYCVQRFTNVDVLGNENAVFDRLRGILGEPAP
jgi:very-short-patch-repair endonuclease